MTISVTGLFGRLVTVTAPMFSGLVKLGVKYQIPSFLYLLLAAIAVGRATTVTKVMKRFFLQLGVGRYL